MQEERDFSVMIRYGIRKDSIPAIGPVESNRGPKGLCYFPFMISFPRKAFQPWLTTWN